MIVRYMCKLSAYVVIALLLYGFSKVACEEGAVKFIDDMLQENLAKDLEELKINYTLDNAGRIWFCLKDLNRIKVIIADILEHEYPKNSFSYLDEKRMNLFMKILDQNEVPYGVKKRGIRIFVFWSDKYDEVVRKIMAKIDDIARQEAIDRMMRLNDRMKGSE